MTTWLCFVAGQDLGDPPTILSAHRFKRNGLFRVHRRAKQQQEQTTTGGVITKTETWSKMGATTHRHPARPPRPNTGRQSTRSGKLYRRNRRQTATCETVLVSMSSATAGTCSGTELYEKWSTVQPSLCDLRAQKKNAA